MSKFKKDSGKSAPGINTSSLPDIVFMLLFFFMVATTTKEADPSVSVKPPEGKRATDMTPYKQRSEIDFIYLGEPRNPARKAEFSGGFALFLDNVAQPDPAELYTANAIGQWKKDKYNSKPSSMTKPIEEVITCVKADKKSPTGMIFEIRKELQEVEALTIAYSVQDKSNI